MSSISSRKCSIPTLSKLFVGSSSNNTLGFVMSAAASNKRACCPPEKLLISLSSGATRLTLLSTLAIIPSSLNPGSSRFPNCPWKKSRTLRSRISRGMVCFAVDTVSPFVRFIFPLPTCRSLVRSFKIDDFPDPFWPISVTLDPLRRENEVFSKRLRS